MLFFGLFFTALAVFDSVLAQRSSCSRDRLRQCSDTLLRSIQGRVVDMNRQEMSAHCTTVRDDFNCLLQETRCLSSENERSRHGVTLRDALKYIRDGCDTNGGSYRDSSCYVGEPMKKCETTFALAGRQYTSHNTETCRKFNLLQDCVMEVVRTRCRPEDDMFLGQYLVDTAQDLAWNCGEPTSSSSQLDRGRDDRYDRNGGGERDRDWDRNNRGDPWRDRDRGGYRDRDNGGYRDRDSGGYRDRDNGGYRDRDRGSDRYDRNGGYDRGNGNSDITCCRNERCSTSRMQQCRDSLTRAVDSRSSGYQDSQKCRKTRDDFNCLMWQTSSCMEQNERDRDNDLFRRARDFISRNCDTYGRWSENSCYKSTEMQRCENGLSTTRGGATYESCRSYNSFRDCMQDELQRRCTREDELHQGAYLADKAQELSWQCGTDHPNNGRNQYFTENRRDRYDSGQSDRYDSPNHLEDDDAMCLSKIQDYNDQCKVTLDEKRREIYITNDYDIRQKITCCSARQYRSCLYDATRRVCQSDRSRVVDSLMGRYTYELSSDNCRKFYDSDCNSGNHYHISTAVLLFSIMLHMLVVRRLQ